MKKTLTPLGLISLVALASFEASAGPVIETFANGTATPGTLGGWAMTDIGDTGASGTLTNSISSGAFSGTINFQDNNGNALDMLRVDASNIASWWNNPEASDNEVFTTSVSWVELILPENTRALSFNVGASFNGWGWMMGYNEGGVSTYSSFDLSPGNTPGFGVYANNSASNCGSISSIVIDPSQWGIGNLSIAQSDQCTADVPEPGVITLLGLGLVGLGIARRQKS